MAPTMSTDSFDLTDFVINKGNGVKGLSDLGLKSLPKQYIQPQEALINIIPHESIPVIDMSNGIPVIDMSNWDTNPKVAESICDAAEKYGFFQLVNHGVPLEVLDGVKDATHRFFGLPAEVKRNYSKELSSTNNVRFGTSFSPDAEKALEWKDYLSLFYVSEDEASALWPSACKDECLEYMKRSEILCKKLMGALMERLNVKETDEKKESLLMGSKRINLNYYPRCPNPNLTIGVGRHSDVSALTFLLQDEIGGLFVRVNEGKGEEDGWVHVPPIEGSLVINVGDALQILSNGRYKSIEHCVIASGSKNRISIPIFVNPKPSDVIGPLPEVLASGEKPKYKNILYSDYVKHFFRKAHDGKKTVGFAEI
ncbi:LOW QUALITY PROTEIN: feruloyl CoA ortho-hydroxylase F6H1-3-like [Jatropha curcas]|uniref:LOW QUALITY PROTEIN: feruloyl CoA ortho-hydroxylase F6H1-3-like n=1 Tax=Jatropha curcas TaxID=180498 RepID=UPI001892E274|nr:LOW QUALITY PROTEIN: feruloyl CoA ortho-hydroxylase F6H1-3-like [Jatropha curcas]